jgi:hypothetical protein
MGRNGRRSPGPTSVDTDEGRISSTIGAPRDSGLRARENAISPASGVRSAQKGELLHPSAPRQLILPRLAFDSEFEAEPLSTRVDVPGPSLLALARGELEAAREPAPQEAEERGEEEQEPEERVEDEAPKRELRTRLAWFGFGIVVGAAITWSAASDVSADVYRARVWVASTLRSIRTTATADVSALPVENGAATSPQSAIPTVDVTQLPKVREEAPGPTAAPVSTPTSPGAPALQHAPGPR